MDSPRWQRGSPFVVAMVGSAAVGGQFIAGKAARNAFFLANFETSSLPLMVLVTAVFSIFSVANHEVAAVDRKVWENRRLLDRFEADDRSFLEELVRDRASHALAHVFTLLALALPAEPLRLAFRGLHTDDQGLRGTALEYLDSVLPRDLRDRLWPFRGSTSPGQPSTPR